MIHNRIVDRTIYVQVEFGLFDRFKLVNATALCALNTTLVKPFRHQVAHKTTTAAATNNASNVGDDATYYYTDDDSNGDDTISYDDTVLLYGSCLNVSGRYHVSSYFTVPKTPDTGYHYTPDIRLTFTDDQSRRVGCAATGPYSLLVANDVRAENGLIALAIACSVFIVIFSLLLLVSNFRKIEPGHATAAEQQKQRQLQFQNHQYFRTLPNGQVMQLPIPPTPHGNPAVSTVFGGSSYPYTNQQQQFFHKSPRPVLTATRRYAPATIQNEASADASNRPSKQGQQPSSSAQHSSNAAYLLNINNCATSEDDDEDEDDDDDRRQISTNPMYNETQLPTRPVI